jgi:hypothetical protein
VKLVHTVRDRHGNNFRCTCSHVLSASSNHLPDITTETCTVEKKVVNLRAWEDPQKSPKAQTGPLLLFHLSLQNGSNSAYSDKCKECAQRILRGTDCWIRQRWYPRIGAVSSCISLSRGQKGGN